MRDAFRASRVESLWLARRWVMVLAGLGGLISAGLSARAASPQPVQVAMVTGWDVEGRSTGEDIGSRWTDNQCGRCHQMDKLFSHPVNVAPRMAVPKDLPLDNGRITCLTCHEGSSQAHAEARLEHSSMLRAGLTESAICTQCHDRSQQTRLHQHGSALGKAHLLPTDRNSARHVSFSRVRSSFATPDEESRTCLSCHDGTITKEVGMTASLGFSASIETAGSDHPVGVAYQPVLDKYGHPQGGMKLMPASALDSRVRLTDGQVTCNSCHSPYSTEPKLLVMSNYRSKLCLSCHDER